MSIAENFFLFLNVQSLSYEVFGLSIRIYFSRNGMISRAILSGFSCIYSFPDVNKIIIKNT